jgi:hypothetical protein
MSDLHVPWGQIEGGETDGGRLWIVEDRDDGSEEGALIADMDLEESEERTLGIETRNVSPVAGGELI